MRVLDGDGEEEGDCSALAKSDGKGLVAVETDRRALSSAGELLSAAAAASRLGVNTGDGVGEPIAASSAAAVVPAYSTPNDDDDEDA